MAQQPFDLQAALSQLNVAASEARLSGTAVENIRDWLTEPRYAQYAPQVAEHIAENRWRELDDAFWTIIPFGTGGRRGKMYPIGSNAINERTIGESAQGLADYVKDHQPQGSELACAIGYDTRHRSREFAELCAEVMVAAGFKVYFLDGYRSTPCVSFTIRYKNCACGIMVTASHNPPSDNAVKAYWANGAQLLPPHDQGVIERVMGVTTIERAKFREALAVGKIEYCQDDVDLAYHAAVVGQAIPGPREVKIIYSPMHGVGAHSVCAVLEADNFKDVELFGPHAHPDGDFPNVPGHVANPENAETFNAMFEAAGQIGADVILSTDPDADRLGCAAPLKRGGSEWRSFTGNQIGALLTEYVLAGRRRAGTLTREHFIVKTMVTSEMVRRIADAYGVTTLGDLHVGFKYIGEVIDQHEEEHFVLGLEESHGYLVGTYARDKDANVAAMLLAELAAECRAEGMSLHEKLEALFWQYGCHAERTVSQTMPGSQGMAQMETLMRGTRDNPPRQLAGMAVRQVNDYLNGQIILPDGSRQPLSSPRGNMVMLLLDEGNYVAVRPSGTEPKVKFYMFTYEPAEQLANLDDARQLLAERLDRLERDLLAMAGP